MYKLRPYQQEAADRAVEFFKAKGNMNAIEVLPTGCHAKGSKVIMSDGSLKKVEDVVVGDLLLGDDGTPRKVLELHRGTDEMYCITPIKGNPFIVNGGHILHLYKTNEGKHYPSCQSGYDEISVRDYLTKSNNYKHLHKLHRASMVEFGKAESLFEPYFLGLYLGDGCSVNGVSIITQRVEVVNYLQEFAKRNSLGFRKAIKKGENKAASYFFPCSYTNRSVPNPLTVVIESLGLVGKKAGEKFIPLQYKTGTIVQRIELLAGLLDTDAYYDQDKNTFEYCSKSLQLAKDVEFVCRSLGLYAQIGKPKVVKGCNYYRIQISGNLDIIPTMVGIRQAHQRRQKKSVLVTGFTVESIGTGEYFGFTLDGNHLYCDEQFFVHHNSGKSLVIAEIANNLEGHTLVFQPSKEILEQNFAKLCSYGVLDCSIYSASFNSKNISRITFATIGSVIHHKEQFQHFNNVIIDECHLVNAKGGMYEEFIRETNCKVLGLTATPYRLSTNSWGAMLKFLTRTRPRIFSKVIYQVQIQDLLKMGFLAELDYFYCPPQNYNENNLENNSTGADYTDESVIREFARVDLYGWLVSIVQRVMNPKDGKKRNGILVFTRFITEAQRLAAEIPSCVIVSGSTPKKEREEILEKFKAGEIKVVANVGVLTTGFDYPELDTIIMARPTKSLSLWYQIVGRAIRPSPKKERGWVIDLCGNLNRFGKVQDLRLVEPKPNMWQVQSNGRQLTNVAF